MSTIARRWYFNAPPRGEIAPDTLVLREEPVASLRAGELLVRTLYLSLDATNRVWLSDWDSYMEPVRLGEPMRGFVVGEVLESRHPRFSAGECVVGLHTWSDFFVTDGAGFQKFERVPGLPLADAFGVLTIAGPTAHYGLLSIGCPRPGETVVVTAAAGAVGALVGQIAKLSGCRAVGVAGSQAKCRWLVEELGFDAAVNYKAQPVLEGLKQHCPDGIDVHFENVGGDALDAGLTLMNDFGRVVICGLISTYNTRERVPGPYMFRNIVLKRLRVQGFVILDHFDQYPRMTAQLVEWIRAGKLRYRLHVVDGIENASQALKLLYDGGNDGKLMVRIESAAGRQVGAAAPLSGP